MGRPIGLAWSERREVALRFHGQNMQFGGRARLLHGFVKPSAVLALVGDHGEPGVLVDPRGRFWKVIQPNRPLSPP